MAGRELLYGCPGGRWNAGKYVVGDWTYNIMSAGVSTSRVLFLSTGTGTAQVQTAYDYPIIPTRTTGFNWDTIVRGDMAVTKTQTGRKISRWPKYDDDLIIKEIFEPEGGLSLSWEWINQIYDLYCTTLDWDNGDFLVWMPLDRNCKVYPVDIVDLRINGEEFDMRWLGTDLTGMHLECADPSARNAYTDATVEVWFKIRPETVPDVGLFMVGGSSTAEAGLFESE